MESGKGRKKAKIQSWDRNIMCLPSSLSEGGEIVIPRAGTRTDLASKGMSGKVHLESWMTEQEVMAEIRSVFRDPMGDDPDFSFSILQSAGAGSRCLVIPSVSTSFQWNAKQVPEPAGQGYIYILAHDTLAISDPERCIWHIDGTHKLIRWRLVIHGAIDGFSHSVVYLKCSNNNRAATVLTSFQQAVQTFGVPLRIRSDHGGENIGVWDYMLHQHNNPLSVITGSSTHNERVERLWRDVNCCVTTPFADTFYELEALGLLDPLNEVDVFCLHNIFLPRINQCLSDFQESWNHHTISSEHNMTPMQLFVGGFMYSTQYTLSDGTGHTTMPVPATSLQVVSVPTMTFAPCPALQQSF